MTVQSVDKEKKAQRYTKAVRPILRWYDFIAMNEPTPLNLK